MVELLRWRRRRRPHGTWRHQRERRWLTILGLIHFSWPILVVMCFGLHCLAAESGTAQELLDAAVRNVELDANEAAFAQK